MKKYKPVDNPAWQPEIILIEALAKAELVEKELEESDFKVTGIWLHGSIGLMHQDSRITENMIKLLSDATGLTIEVLDPQYTKQTQTIQIIVGLKEE